MSLIGVIRGRGQSKSKSLKLQDSSKFCAFPTTLWHDTYGNIVTYDMCCDTPILNHSKQNAACCHLPLTLLPLWFLMEQKEKSSVCLLRGRSLHKTAATYYCFKLRAVIILTTVFTTFLLCRLCNKCIDRLISQLSHRPVLEVFAQCRMLYDPEPGQWRHCSATVQRGAAAKQKTQRQLGAVWTVSMTVHITRWTMFLYSVQVHPKWTCCRPRMLFVCALCNSSPLHSSYQPGDSWCNVCSPGKHNL